MKQASMRRGDLSNPGQSVFFHDLTCSAAFQGVGKYPRPFNDSMKQWLNESILSPPLRLCRQPEQRGNHQDKSQSQGELSRA